MFQHVKWLEESAATALVLMEIAIDGAASPTTTEAHRMHERIARLNDYVPCVSGSKHS